jgi:hypothetical protein
MNKNVIYSLGKKLPPIKRLLEERDQLKLKLDKLTHDRGVPNNIFENFAPAGHFYSAIPSMKDVKERENKLWGPRPEQLKAIDLNIERQLELFREFCVYYRD